MREPADALVGGEPLPPVRAPLRREMVVPADVSRRKLRRELNTWHANAAMHWTRERAVADVVRAQAAADTAQERVRLLEANGAPEQELAIANSSPDNIKIAATAVPPGGPVGPQRNRNIMIAFLLSLVFPRRTEGAHS